MAHQKRIPISDPNNDKDAVELEGSIERIVYQSEDSGFLVARFRVSGTEDLETITGNNLPDLQDMPLRIRAVPQEHPRFGRQYRVVEFETRMPTDRLGLLRYLGSGLLKGIGPHTAELIVNHFGDKTVETLDNEPRRLLEIKGIGKKKLDMILLSWDKQRSLRKVMVFLQSHNVSQGYAMKIYRAYGEHSIQVLKHDPYRLAREITGIGFRIADRIALNLGVEKESPARIQGGIEFAMEQAADDGHVFLPEAELVRQAQALLEVEEGLVAETLERLFLKGGQRHELIKDEDRVYIGSYYNAECEVAARLADLAGFPDPLNLQVGRRIVSNIQRNIGIELTEQQIQTLHRLLESRVVALTGGPGTGKTVTTRAVIRMFEELDLSVKLAAPTGRAAKRMTEATGKEASTIHRMLEFLPNERRFARDRENPIEADALILDEVSMVDLKLMRSLLAALPLRCRLLLVGDVDQLPSVGAGNVLRDVIESGALTVVRLERIFRQADESLIVTNAHRINKGEMPLVPMKGVETDFYMIQRETPQETILEILSLVGRRLPRKYGFSPATDIQVMTPMHKGLLGVENLNVALQEELNSKNRTVVCGQRSLRLGDKVMQIKNNYDKDVFNGDIGVVQQINQEAEVLTVAFPDKNTNYQFNEMDQLVLAYAITIHKSQGSEYPAVVIPVSTQHFVMLQRNLIYTALTRARKLAVFVGGRKAIAIAVKNNKIEERHSWLNQRIRLRAEEMKKEAR